jgi:hypothetical protein
MRTTLLRPAITLLLFGLVAPHVRAAMPEPPPRWAVGEFRGFNRKYRLEVELRIDRNGILRRWTWKRGESRNSDDFVEGGWENGLLVFVGDRFRVERTNGGFIATKEADRNDVTEFRRAGGGVDRTPVPTRTPRDTDVRIPSWAVGTFRGPNRKYKLEVELRISRSGSVERSIWNRDKDRDKPDTATGRWEDGEIVVGGDHYTVEKTRDGIRTEKRSDNSDVTNLRRR